MPSRNKSSFSMLPSTYGANVDDFVHFDEALFPFQDFDSLDFTTKPNQYQHNGMLDSFYPSQLSVSPVQSMSDMSDSFPATSNDDDWLTSLNPDVLSSPSGVGEDSKRVRDGIAGDARNACWASPLCPSKNEEGTRPDSCRGECADLLFALPSDTSASFENEIMPKTDPKVVIIPSLPIERRSKRSSPGSKLEPSPPPKASPTISTSPEKTEKPKRRVPHSQVEKKYRENVNSQLEALRRAVPFSGNDSSGTYDIEDLGASTRQPSKATILSNATSYIKQLEKENERMLEDVANLKAQNRTLQLVLNGNSASLLNSIERWKIENES